MSHKSEQYLTNPRPRLFYQSWGSNALIPSPQQFSCPPASCPVTATLLRTPTIHSSLQSTQKWLDTSTNFMVTILRMPSHAKVRWGMYVNFFLSVFYPVSWLVWLVVQWLWYCHFSKTIVGLPLWQWGRGGCDSSNKRAVEWVDQGMWAYVACQWHLIIIRPITLGALPSLKTMAGPILRPCQCLSHQRPKDLSPIRAHRCCQYMTMGYHCLQTNSPHHLQTNSPHCLHLIPTSHQTSHQMTSAYPSSGKLLLLAFLANWMAQAKNEKWTIAEWTIIHNSTLL